MLTMDMCYELSLASHKLKRLALQNGFTIYDVVYITSATD